MRTVRRRPFTLLEIMIVLAIIGMIAATTTVGVTRLLADQHFRAGVAVVEERLQMAQDVMLIYRKLVTVTLKQTPKGLVVTLKMGSCPKKLMADCPKELMRYFGEGNSVTLKGITSLGMDWDTGRGVESVDEVRLQFESSGSTMSRGVLYLSKEKVVPREGSGWRSIALRGYPYPLIAGTQTELPKQDRDEIESEGLYPQELKKAA